MIRKPVADRGRPVERTSLAWVRTGLSYCLVALLAARVASDRVTLAAAVVAVGAVTGAMVLLGRVEDRYRRSSHEGLLVPRVSPAQVAAMTGLVVALSLVGLGLVLVHA